MKNLSIFSLKLFFFIFVSLKKTKQCIYSFIYFLLTIINPKMIFEQLLGPTDIPKAQTLYIYKTTKIFLIDEHENFLLATF